MRISRLTPAWALALALACSSGPSDPGGNPNPNPDPDPDPTPTLQSVSCTLDAIDDVEYEGDLPPAVWFSWSGQGHLSDGSTVALDSTIVRLGGTRLLGYTGRTSGEGTLGSDDTTDGRNDLSVICYRGSKSTTASRTFGIYRLVTMSFEAIHFFSREPNDTGLTITVSDGSPSPRAVTLDAGTGSLKVRQGTVDVQIQDTDSGQLHYLERVGAPSGEHLVFDRQDIPEPLEVDDAAEYQIVSVDDQQFLEDMAQQWNTVSRTPMPGTLRIVLYLGNPTCNPNWQPEYPELDDCADLTWPPGKPMTQDGIDNFLTFVDETRANLANPIIPWTPWTIEAVLADTAAIGEYVESVNSFGLATARISNVHIVIGTIGGPLREGSDNETDAQQVEYLFASSATSNGVSPFVYSNEMQIFGSLMESFNYPICSVRDNEEEQHPDCPLSTAAPTYFEIDKKMHAVAATYLARAQTQPVPFNVRLPEP